MVFRNGSLLPVFESFPLISGNLTWECRFPRRYYLNYVTFDYSLAFWGWEEWEREIDWMALQGINLPLAIVGTEAVWQNTMRRLRFDENEIREFIPGPAYTSWWLMGNLEGWGGPVSQQWIDNQASLQKKITASMRSLGMKPVLPAFFGIVPNSSIVRFQNHNIHKDGEWGGFQRPAFIDPSDPLFATFASVFYEEQEKLFGKSVALRYGLF